ncbi:MAG: trypsin-like peptidase domain-containing protein, partial [Candidatus Obscuribacterales bacterium]|nr:trypsin-like peptidase domain-containing protein [Steroidobacteraceae bacterium]
MNLSSTASLFCGCVFTALFVAPSFAAAPTKTVKAASQSADAIPSTLENSVVKVFSTTRPPDPFRPWSKQPPRDITGSGVIIEGKRILTNAHVVLYAGQVQVQANQAGDKISATVVAIAPGIDLAILKLDDESFFDTRPPVVRANILPAIKDTVLAYGFPTGGTSLSITKGIVSRIEFMPYNFPVSGLRIQIDAAINPGNSGGPAIADDKMIGLAFAGLGNAQSIGYIIPNEEIEIFLQDIKDGSYDGKPAMYDSLQTLENPALRSFLKLDKTVEGMIVHRPHRTEAAYPLKEWDVITRIGEFPIDNQGMTKLGGLRVNFRYRVQQVAKSGSVPLTIVREGKSLPIELAVAADRPLLIPDLGNAYPAYFIYGPVVFSKATNQFLSFISNNAASMNGYAFNGSPLVVRRGDAPDASREELVVVSAPFFPHKLTNGFSSRFGSVVDSINGTPVRSLAHLVELLRDTTDEFLTIRFEQHSGETLVLARKEVLAATEEILTDNGVRLQGST